MPQRLPAIFALGALSLLASAAPSLADEAPAHRRPAVPPLPTAQSLTAPSTTAQPISVSQSPLADPSSPRAPNAASLPNMPVASTPIATAALKREARTEGDSNIALASFMHPIELSPSMPVRIALNEAPANVATGKAAQLTNAQEPSEASAGTPVGDVVKKDDLATFLPDVELKDISQDTPIGYQSGYMPLPNLNVPTEEPVTQLATLALPDIKPTMKPTVTLDFTARVELYVGDVVSAGDQEAPKTELASIRPRPRPEGVVASIEEKPADPEKVVAPKAEPVFSLRR